MNLKTISAVLLLFVLPSLADAQLFRRRDRYVPTCPGPDCSIPNNHPGLNPEASKPEQPDPTIMELESIIPAELRIRNRGGNCGWCALEDVMVAAGYDQFKGITARAITKGWSGNTISNVKAAIRDAGVDALIVEDRSYSIFQHARTEGVGVYVQIPGHALVCVGLDSDHAYMLDNNPDSSGQLKILKWARSKFDRLWEGVACCPRNRKKDKPDNTKPAAPVSPAKPCDCPKVDLKPIEARLSALEAAAKNPPAADPKAGELTNNVSNLTQNVDKLTQIILGQSKSIEGITSAVKALDARVTALEKQKPTTPPMVLSRIEQVK